MANSWYSSWNPFGSVDDNGVTSVLDNQTSGAGATQGDWWAYDQNGKDAGGSKAWHTRLGRTVSDALGGAGYYTDQSSQMNLGANIATLVDLARAKAAAEGNIGGTSNPDTVKNYLKQYLKQYLTTGNMGAATGIAGAGSTGTNYRDAFGQINANAAAGTPEQKNWYKNNQLSIERGINAMNDLQTGGGLRSANADTIGSVFNRADSNNGQFWQDANGGVISPWGGSFTSRLQPPPVAPPPTPGPSDSPGNPANPTPPAATPPPYGGATPQGPGAPPTVPAGTDPNASKLAVPAAATNPTGWTIAPAMNPGADVSFDRQLETLWTNLFGRAPTPQERQQWMTRLYDRYGGDASAVIRDLENSAPAQRYKQTGVAAPVVQNGQDTQGAQQYYDWLQPGQTPEDWIRGYLQQIGGA